MGKKRLTKTADITNNDSEPEEDMIDETKGKKKKVARNKSKSTKNDKKMIDDSSD